MRIARRRQDRRRKGEVLSTHICKRGDSEQRRGTSHLLKNPQFVGWKSCVVYQPKPTNIWSQ